MGRFRSFHEMLAVDRLSFSFSRRLVLDGASFQLRPASITCLVGGNGSGKTTLLNLITGFLRPDSGRIRLGAHELVGVAPFRIGRLGVRRTFQDLRLIGKLSVRNNLLMSLPCHPGERLRGALVPSIFHRERDLVDNRRVMALLSDWSLAEVADKLASEISYGQQKLLTLACCAAMDASVLLLDEPVAGIAPEFREHISQRLATFKAAGKSILLVEHQADFLERTGDAFLFLQSGRLSHFGTLAELRASQHVHEILN